MSSGRGLAASCAGSSGRLSATNAPAPAARSSDAAKADAVLVRAIIGFVPRFCNESARDARTLGARAFRPAAGAAGQKSPPAKGRRPRPRSRRRMVARFAARPARSRRGRPAPPSVCRAARSERPANARNARASAPAAGRRPGPRSREPPATRPRSCRSQSAAPSPPTTTWSIVRRNRKIEAMSSGELYSRRTTVRQLKGVSGGSPQPGPGPERRRSVPPSAGEPRRSARRGSAPRRRSPVRTAAQ